MNLNFDNCLSGRNPVLPRMRFVVAPLLLVAAAVTIPVMLLTHRTEGKPTLPASINGNPLISTGTLPSEAEAFVHAATAPDSGDFSAASAGYYGDPKKPEYSVFVGHFTRASGDTFQSIVAHPPRGLAAQSLSGSARATVSGVAYECGHAAVGGVCLWLNGDLLGELISYVPLAMQDLMDGVIRTADAVGP